MYCQGYLFFAPFEMGFGAVQKVLFTRNIKKIRKVPFTKMVTLTVLVKEP